MSPQSVSVSPLLSIVKPYLTIVLMGMVLFLTNLGATRLWDVDEAIFSRAAVEMMDRGDWVTPYYNGEMFGHKPPFMYWCQIAAFRVFGTTEFAARFFSALFGIGTMLLTFELGRTLFNRRVGMWGAIALGSCINFAVIARAATPDVYLTFFCTLALLVLAKGVWKSNDEAGWQPVLPPSWLTYALAYAAIALAVLVKGPLIGAIVPMAVWGMFLLIEQRRQDADRSQSTNKWMRVLSWFAPLYFLKTVWRMRPLTAIAMILLIAGPWYAWVGIRTNGEFLREFFFVHNIGRATQPMDSHSGPIYYYLLAVCIGAFPWCVLLAPAIGNLVRSICADDAERSAFTLLACCTGVWIGLLSLAGTKLPSYIIPCYPALAIVFAVVVDQWASAMDAERCRRWLRAAWGTTAVVGLGILVAVPFVTRIYLGGEWTPALIGLVPLAGAAIGLWLSEHAMPRYSLLTLAIVAIAFSVGLLGFAALPIDAHQNSQMFADFVREHSSGQPHLASHNYLPPSLVYYGRQRIERVGTAEEIADYFHEHPRDAYVITTSKHFEALASTLPGDVKVLERDRRFLRSGDVILLGRPGAIQAARRPFAKTPR